MKKLAILLCLISFAFCASGDDILLESQTNRAKADTTKEMYSATIGGSQYINYQWSLIAKEKTQENYFLRTTCLLLVAGGITYVSAGATATIFVSGLVGAGSLYLWECNNK